MLNSDLPIKNAEDDKLNRSGFSSDLARAIMNRDISEGFVIGMYGKWGSGKTSVINMVLDQLRNLSKGKSDAPIILEFNPWLCSDPKQLVSQFFKQLSATIEKSRDYLTNVCGYMDSYAEVFDLAGELPNVGGLFKLLGKWRSKKAAEHNGNLQAIKNKISENLEQHKVRLVVTIDDIDRLSNSEIVSVFQLVKALADFPYATYLLAFDRDIVSKALSEVQKGDGNEYLEKIIQAPFELPASNPEDIWSIFTHRLTNILGDQKSDDWDDEYWSDLFYYGLRHYLKTIRHVIRFTNTLALKYSIVKEEVNVLDFIALTCLQVFEPTVYAKLPIHKNEIVGTGHGGYGRHDDYQYNKIESSWQAIISDVPEEKHEQVKNILSGMFPNLGRIVNSKSFHSPMARNITGKELILSNSICRDGSFNRYFSLNLEGNAVPSSHLNWIVEKASEAEIIESLKKLSEEKRLSRLLDFIDPYFSSDNTDTTATIERAVIIFNALCKSWNELEDSEASSFLAIPFIWRFFWCSRALLMKLNEENRVALLQSTFNNAEIPLSTKALLLHDMERDHGRFDEKDRDKTPILPLEKILEMEKVFFRCATNEMKAGHIIENFSWTILHLLENIDADTANDAISEMLKTDYGLLNLITSAKGGGKIGDRYTTRYVNIASDVVEKYIPVECAYKRIKELTENITFLELPRFAKQSAITLLFHVEVEPSEEDGFTRRNDIHEKSVDERIVEIEAFLQKP